MNGASRSRGVDVSSGKTNDYKNSGTNEVEAVSAIVISQGSGSSERVWRLFVSPITSTSENVLSVQYKKGSQWVTCGKYIGEKND